MTVAELQAALADADPDQDVLVLVDGLGGHIAEVHKAGALAYDLTSGREWEPVVLMIEPASVELEWERLKMKKAGEEDR